MRLTHGRPGATRRAGRARSAESGPGACGARSWRARRSPPASSSTGTGTTSYDDGKVQIIDEYTGRLMPDRSWEHGLHQLIEVKEGVAVTAHARHAGAHQLPALLPPLPPAGRDDRYRARGGGRALGGVPAGRGRGSRPTGRLAAWCCPSACIGLPRLRWVAVVERVRALYAAGRPVLVGTRSVAASEELAARLAAAGLPHRVLNARQDSEEAQIVAEAGQPGRITVATNMAGRGTDIRLAPGRARAGRASRDRHRASRRRAHRPPALRPLRPPGRPRERTRRSSRWKTSSW